MTRVEVLFRDARWLVLDKPAGLPTAGPVPSGRETLVDIARRIAKDTATLHPLSRLDADVTGAVIFALTHKAARRADEARREGRYRRCYLGLTSAPPTPTEGAWTWPLAIDPKDATRRTTGEGREPQDARTEYRTLATSPGAVALVAFWPVTGRTHQIRVHAQAAGAPLLGDVVYGGARRVVLGDGAVVSARRVMLHAWRVELTGEDWSAEAPVASDFRACWEAAGGAPDVIERPSVG